MADQKDHFTRCMMTEAERRYHHDPEFHAAVDMLHALARKHGYTPYELKQIAFTAALLHELHSARAFRVPFESDSTHGLARGAKRDG